MMIKFISAVKKFASDENGVTAIEYGLIAALIAVGISVAVTTLASDLKATFTTIAGKLTTANSVSS